jgi:hypothetical protein
MKPGINIHCPYQLQPGKFIPKIYALLRAEMCNQKTCLDYDYDYDWIIKKKSDYDYYYDWL